MRTDTDPQTDADERFTPATVVSNDDEMFEMPDQQLLKSVYSAALRQYMNCSRCSVIRRFIQVIIF